MNFHSLAPLNWYSSTRLILWDMPCLQKNTGFIFILICLIVLFVEVRSGHRKYSNFESRGRCENRNDINNIENGGFIRTIRTGSHFLWRSPIRTMKFRAPEVIYYLTLKKEHDAKEKCHSHLLDITKKWFKRKVIFKIQKNLILTHTYLYV